MILVKNGCIQSRGYKIFLPKTPEPEIEQAVSCPLGNITNRKIQEAKTSFSSKNKAVIRNKADSWFRILLPLLPSNSGKTKETTSYSFRQTRGKKNP